MQRLVGEFEVRILHRLSDSAGLLVLLLDALVSLVHLALKIREA